ncbi:MAG: hypothetical protein FWD55_09050 [Propionibacteriaceae bacterium]|nr:hypothetical protein [Propionibacteriaceae bacterium]
MSALVQEVTPARVKRTALKPVIAPARTRAWPKGFFPVVILAMLAAGMVGQLMLQTTIQEQGFELAALQTELEQLQAQEAILNATLDKQSTPQALAYAASQLGMVVNPYSNILVLSDGQVIGSGKKVKGNEQPIISAPPAFLLPPPPSPSPSPELDPQGVQP